MFRLKTLFVLGAGASKEVGLPTGAELSVQLAKKLNFTTDDLGRREGGDPVMFRILHQKARGEGTDPSLYWRAGRSVAHGVKYSRSIDEFINKHRDDACIAYCAKLGIAQCISEMEAGSHMFVDESGSRRDFLRIAELSKSWFLEFATIFQEGVRKTDVAQIGKGVSIVNFNYDRCVEQYIFHSLQHSYGIEGWLAAEALQGVQIIHPYGYLGKLPWQGHGGIPFGGEPHGTTDIAAIAGRIRTFYEQLENEQDLTAMRQAVADAEKIVLLGFGFHPQNVAMLTPGAGIRAREIFATAYGESQSAQEIIRNQIKELAGNRTSSFSEAIHVHDMTCTRLMREYARDLAAN